MISRSVEKPVEAMKLSLSVLHLLTFGILLQVYKTVNFFLIPAGTLWHSCNDSQISTWYIGMVETSQTEGPFARVFLLLWSNLGVVRNFRIFLKSVFPTKKGGGGGKGVLAKYELEKVWLAYQSMCIHCNARGRHESRRVHSASWRSIYTRSELSFSKRSFYFQARKKLKVRQ